MTKFASLAAMTVAGLLLSGCDSAPAPTAKTADAAAASLQAGEYEISRTVDSISSTDKSTPKSKLKAGDKDVVKACFDGKAFPAEAFSEPGDKCTVQSNYISNGRMSTQLSCTRAGSPGQLVPSIDGDFKADSFTANAMTVTYFQGPGDYQLVRKVEGKRTGACAA